jgi:hypothetical protein
MSALDANVIKTYVELRLGIGVIASVALDPARDTRLNLLDSSHLFEKTNDRHRRPPWPLSPWLCLSRHRILPASLTETAIRSGVKSGADTETTLDCVQGSIHCPFHYRRDYRFPCRAFSRHRFKTLSIWRSTPLDSFGK